MASGDDLQTIWLPDHIMRARAEVPSTSRTALDAVRGFLRPRYVEEMPDGRRVAELTQEGIQRVAEGYACGKCLAYFDRRFTHCPACSKPLEPNIDIVDYSPPHWQDGPSRTSEEILEDGNGLVA